MTNTETSNLEATLKQINDLETAGADLIEYLVQIKSQQKP